MPSPRTWQVVGGTERGGILVREGQDLKSAAADQRLSKGSLVQEVRLVGERLQYLLLEGDGPTQGWVSIKTSGKELLVLKSGPQVASASLTAIESANDKTFLSAKVQVPESPVAQAVRKGKFPVLMSLLEDGHDPNESGGCCGRPLSLALELGDFNAATTLLLYKADITAKHKERAQGNALCSLVRVFSDEEFDAPDLKALLGAADGFIRPWLEEELQSRRSRRVATQVQERPSLTAAVRRGQLDEVLSLLRSRADPNEVDAVGETALFEAALLPDAEVAAALLLGKADPQRISLSGTIAENMANPAPKAVIRAFSGYRGALTAALAMLKDPIRKFVADRLGEEAPARAATTEERLRAATMETPDEGTATVALWRDSGSSLVAMAVAAGDLPKLRVLLRGGAEVDGCDLTGETALFEAASQGDADLMALLLLHRADPNHRSVSGATPMTYAASEATQGLLRIFAGDEITHDVHKAVLAKLSDPDIFEPVSDIVRERMMASNLQKMSNRLRQG
mmetsp:Transcript_44599/g.105749  ORF Transcript_44599/g.105749 Transcript_44599/m.105749 type:complete len:512 (+) Transcript_44599:75-1610(+)